MLLSILTAFSVTLAQMFGEAFRLYLVVLGGCVLWCVFVLVRWVLNGCTFHNKGGRRR